jgi:hypothetical protein
MKHVIYSFIPLFRFQCKMYSFFLILFVLPIYALAAFQGPFDDEVTFIDDSGKTRLDDHR